jgi:integration host factor subunit beta
MVSICLVFQEAIRGDSMNKMGLIEELKKEGDLTANEAKRVIGLFFDEISNALAKGDRVEIRGFCSFYVKHYKAYTGRNPKTGEQIKTKSKKLPFFKVGKELQERVDYQG